MDEANVNQTGNESPKPFTQVTQFPTVITTDDLIVELGKNVVDNINKEKLLLNILNKSKAAETKVQQLLTEQTHLTKEVENLRVSNKVYEETNRVLGNELTAVRVKLAEAEANIAKINATFEEERVSLLKKCEEVTPGKRKK